MLVLVMIQLQSPNSTWSLQPSPVLGQIVSRYGQRGMGRVFGCRQILTLSKVQIQAFRFESIGACADTKINTYLVTCVTSA